MFLLGFIFDFPVNASLISAICTVSKMSLLISIACQEKEVAQETILDRPGNGWIFGIQVLKHTLFQFSFYHYFLEKIS